MNFGQEKNQIHHLMQNLGNLIVSVREFDVDQKLSMFSAFFVMLTGLECLIGAAIKDHNQNQNKMLAIKVHFSMITKT